MKFITKLFGCWKSKKERAVEKTGLNSFMFSKQSFSKSGAASTNLPKWVEMKCNALVYLKQIMKYNRKNKKQHFKPESQEDTVKPSRKEPVRDLETTSLKTEKEPDNIEATTPQISENMSMMCPICHFFMYKSVCASCGHMYCQFCLDEYLIFKESCPVCEKSIRRGKITRCWVADSAIEKILSFSNEEYIKEWELKKKREDEYYNNKKADNLTIPFDMTLSSGSDGELKEIIIDARDSEYIWWKAEVIATIESRDKDNSILVHYKGWSRKYDEVLPLTSPRIAKIGFYTSREDIPHYQDSDNKSKKPVLNLPTSNDKIEIIEELKKDCFKSHEGNCDQTSLGESGEELYQEEDVYEYLIDKVSTQSRGMNRDFRALNSQSSFLHFPPGNRGGDVRIRVNTSSFNRLRSVLNRNF